MDDFIFDREEELQALKERLLKRKPFLLHGPTGAGKTLLIRSLLAQMPSVFYCEISATTQLIFRSVAQFLLERGDPRVRRSCRNREGIQTKSAVSLKGIVMDALREGSYSIALDHVDRPSQSFAAAVREIIGWCSTPIIAVARSSHMEDTGFLAGLPRVKSKGLCSRFLLGHFIVILILRGGLFGAVQLQDRSDPNFPDALLRVRLLAVVLPAA